MHYQAARGLSCQGEHLMLRMQTLLETGQCLFALSVTDVLTLLQQGAP
jgi:hypothetical protein